MSILEDDLQLRSLCVGVRIAIYVEFMMNQIISEVKDCDLPRVLEISLFGGKGN